MGVISMKKISLLLTALIISFFCLSVKGLGELADDFLVLKNKIQAVDRQLCDWIMPLMREKKACLETSECTDLCIFGLSFLLPKKLFDEYRACQDLVVKKALQIHEKLIKNEDDIIDSIVFPGLLRKLKHEVNRCSLFLEQAARVAMFYKKQGKKSDLSKIHALATRYLKNIIIIDETSDNDIFTIDDVEAVFFCPPTSTEKIVVEELDFLAVKKQILSVKTAISAWCNSLINDEKKSEYATLAHPNDVDQAIAAIDGRFNLLLTPILCAAFKKKLFAILCRAEEVQISKIDQNPKDLMELTRLEIAHQRFCTKVDHCLRFLEQATNIFVACKNKGEIIDLLSIQQLAYMQVKKTMPSEIVQKEILKTEGFFTRLVKKTIHGYQWIKANPIKSAFFFAGVSILGFVTLTKLRG
jgi:hypothetical protein